MLKPTDWDAAYLQLQKIEPLPPQPEPHWGWTALGALLGTVAMAALGVLLAEVLI